MAEENDVYTGLPVYLPPRLIFSTRIADHWPGRSSNSIELSSEHSIVPCNDSEYRGNLQLPGGDLENTSINLQTTVL
jgi:hypothetical protein